MRNNFQFPLANIVLLFIIIIIHCSFATINLQQELKEGYSVSLLPNANPGTSWTSKNTIYAKISEIKYERNKPTGDRYYGFIPIFEASLFPDKSASQFEASCFKEYSAQITSFNTEGVEVTVKVGKKSNPLCYDLFLFATQTTLRLHMFQEIGSYSLNFSWVSQYEKENVEENGFILFYLPDGVLGTVLDIWSTYQLFMGPKTFEDGIQFYKDHMNLTFVNRTVPNFVPDESEIMDGDYIGLLDFHSDPEGEGLGSLIAWGTGGHTSHTAVCMRVNGTLYVFESNANGVQKTLYKDWMTTSPDVLLSLARLRPDLRAKFNNESAIAWFNKVNGLPYGYQNFVFGWIDTENGNYPPPATGQDIPALLVLANYIFPFGGNLIFGEGLNQRLGTTGLSLMQILDECDTRNISVIELITVPEQDSFVYANPTGPRFVCDVFVLSLYKQAGVFGDLDFQATELTPKDSYQLQIFDNDWVRPQGCANDSQPGLCQVTGMFWLELPGFNSIAPYTNMDQKCAAIPFKYIRSPPNC